MGGGGGGGGGVALLCRLSVKIFDLSVNLS